MTNSTSLHEDSEKLGIATLDRHRAIVSLMEELEAIDWYSQREKAAGDDELRSILAHNRDEEKEHAAMLIEWLRRNDDAFAGHLKTYLYSERSITQTEREESEGSKGTVAPSSLRVGTLRRSGQEAQ